MTAPAAESVVSVDTRDLTGGRHYTFCDAFAGAGGMTLGFVQAGFQPVLAVECDPDAAATHRRNFPNVWLHEGRIEDLGADDVMDAVGDREVHLLCGGVPCQGFSSAGRRDAGDARNHLYQEFIRIARTLRPWFVVMENVPGILHLASGAFRRAIADEFAEAGYPGMSVRLLQGAEYGVPQVRRRALFVGNRFGLPNPYPAPLLNRRHWVPVEVAIGDLIDRPRDPATNHEWTRHGPEMEDRLARLAPGAHLYGYSGSWRRLQAGEPAPTIKHNNGAPHVHHLLPRTISAREMARLQSFPDEFVFCGDMASVMLQVGNAVPPLLARHVALALRPSLDQIVDSLTG